MATKYSAKNTRVLFDTIGLTATAAYTEVTNAAAITEGEYYILTVVPTDYTIGATGICEPVITTSLPVGTLVKVTTTGVFGTTSGATKFKAVKITPVKYENMTKFGFSPSEKTTDVSDNDSGFASDELITGYDTKFTLDAWYTEGTVQQLALSNLGDTTEFWVTFAYRSNTGSSFWTAPARGSAVIDTSGEAVALKFNGVFTLMPLKQTQTANNKVLFA